MISFTARLENAVKCTQTREFRPSRCGDANINVASRCLETEDLTWMYLFVGGNFRHLTNIARSKKFKELCKEYRALQHNRWED